MGKSDSIVDHRSDSSNRVIAGALEPSAGVRKHRQIFDSLHNEILSGKYGFGDRVPSETS